MESRSIWHFIFILIVSQQGISGDEIRLDQSPAVIKRPGETVKVSCKISGFTMTEHNIHWIRQKPGKALEWIGRVDSGRSSRSDYLIYADSVKNYFTMSEDVSQSTQYLEAKSLREEDTAVYYCARVIRGVDAFDYWGKGTKVTVSSAQPSPPKSIFSLSQCSAGSDNFITIGCLTRGFFPADSLTFKWKAPGNKELNDFVQYPAFGSDGDYTKISHLRVKKADWNPQNPYICEASNSKGSVKTTLAPPAPPPDQPATVYLTVPTKQELDNGTATFTCLARQFSPKTYSFKWFQNDVEVNSLDTCDASEKNGSVTFYSATSIFQISADKWMNADTKIKCKFEHKAGDESREAEYLVPLQDDCDIDVIIDPPSLESMLKNRSGVLKCRASGEPGFKTMEIKANTFVIRNQSNFMNKEKVELDASLGYEEWSNGTTFKCTVEHKCLVAGPKHVTFSRENGKEQKRPSVYLLAPPEYKENEKMTLTCYVKDFYPKEVFVSWLVDDEPATGYKHNTSLPIQNDKYFSVYSQITVDSSKWKNGAVYSCVVYHETIDENMRVLTRSIADNTDKPGVINLSMNVPGSCKE